jgi:hypothetical protein
LGKFEPFVLRALAHASRVGPFPSARSGSPHPRWVLVPRRTSLQVLPRDGHAWRSFAAPADSLAVVGHSRHRDRVGRFRSVLDCRRRKCGPHLLSERGRVHDGPVVWRSSSRLLARRLGSIAVHPCGSGAHRDWSDSIAPRTAIAACCERGVDKRGCLKAGSRRSHPLASFAGRICQEGALDCR